MTDFDFSPFHDSLLATAAEDGVVSVQPSVQLAHLLSVQVKVWQIPEGGVSPQVPPTGTALAPVGVRDVCLYD